MGWRFGPDDEESFVAARDELVSRFEAIPHGTDAGWVAAQVLDFKWGYLDGDLARWGPDDVGIILLDLYPAKVMLDLEDVDVVVAGFARFMGFLGGEGIVAPDRATRLAELVEQLGPQFQAAAMDERNWSMGKRLWTVAQSEGVDPTDAGAVERLIDDFNQRPFAERDVVLGPGSGGFAPAPPIEPLPPVVLAPEDELIEAARNTVWFSRVVRLVDYVGEGRQLTGRHNLKLADGKALVDLLETGDRFDERIGDRVFKTRSTGDLGVLDRTFRMAMEAQILARDRRAVVPGPNVGLVADHLGAVDAGFNALLTRVGPTQHRYGGRRYGWGWYAGELDAFLPLTLIDLYRHGPADIEDLAEDAWIHMLDVFDLDDVPADTLAFQRSSVVFSVRHAFDVLVELGVVRVDDVREVSTEYGFTERSGGTAGLTPLGTWAVQRLASRVTIAPVAGGLRDLTAAELLVVASDLPDREALAEIDAWVDHHGDDAARLLVAALPAVGDTGRGLGFRALLRIGPAAAAAVDLLGDDPTLSAYATVWRVDAGLADREEMDCTGDPERFVRLLGAVIDVWGPAAAVNGWAATAAGADGLVSMIDSVWRVTRPETEQVLAAIGSVHPDKEVAKAARRALFKHRSQR